MDFTDEQRQIYEYYDGERTVKADPLELRWKLVAATGGKSGELVDDILACDANADPAAKVAQARLLMDRLVPLIREVFALKPFDKATGAGMTAAMCLAVWNRYHQWVAQKKSSTGSPRTSPPCTGPTPAAPTSTPSDCG